MMQITAVVPLNSVRMRWSECEEEKERVLSRQSCSAHASASTAASFNCVLYLGWPMRKL